MSMLDNTAKLLPLQERADCPENSQQPKVNIANAAGTAEAASVEQCFKSIDESTTKPGKGKTVCSDCD